MGIVISAYTINPSVRRSMPYDTLTDLQGITQLADSKLVLVTRADAPFNTVPELITQARQHPGKLTYASPGAGTSTHLAGEMFKHAAGVDIVDRKKHTSELQSLMRTSYAFSCLKNKIKQ